ncbi:hypothetical protein, partial [Mucilaginibacter sp. L3T2-6]|uniref:hypothetical protein n=1 Tax=Mucilaginibacter sp. L3T2-6 TaxID=3062491 RepID=UPI0026757798
TPLPAAFHNGSLLINLIAPFVGWLCSIESKTQSLLLLVSATESGVNYWFKQIYQISADSQALNLTFVHALTIR